VYRIERILFLFAYPNTVPGNEWELENQFFPFALIKCPWSVPPLKYPYEVPSAYSGSTGRSLSYIQGRWGSR